LFHTLRTNQKIIEKEEKKMIEYKEVSIDEYQKMLDARLQFQKDAIKLLNKECVCSPLHSNALNRWIKVLELKDLNFPSYLTKEKYDFKIHYLNKLDKDRVRIEIVRKKTNKIYSKQISEDQLKDAELNYQCISQFNYRDDLISATLIALVIQSELRHSMPYFLSIFARRFIDPKILDQNRINRILKCLD
jgi:hypothetical protein